MAELVNGAVEPIAEIQIKNKPRAIVVDSDRVRGGNRIVNTLAERDAIEADARKEEIFIVRVRDIGTGEGMTYHLKGGIGNEHWAEYTTGAATPKTVEPQVGEVLDYSIKRQKRATVAATPEVISIATLNKVDLGTYVRLQLTSANAEDTVGGLLAAAHNTNIDLTINGVLQSVRVLKTGFNFEASKENHVYIECIDNAPMTFDVCIDPLGV
jgi:hypothetical protein